MEVIKQKLVKSTAETDDFVGEVVKQVEAKFGVGSATTLETDKILAYVPGYVSTRCTGLDWAIGRAGIPLGRFIEIVGLESTSKTALGIHILAECQARGGVAILMDTENAFDPTFARNLGLNTKHLICLQPESIEDVFAEQEHIIQVVTRLKKDVPVVILHDSLAASPPRMEVEGDFGAVFPAAHARAVAIGIRKILPTITKAKIAVVVINQLKEKIGVVFGEKYVSPGGRALKYHASVRIRVDRTGYIRQNNDIIGIPIRARVIKNKVAVPFRETHYDFYFDRGIDDFSSVLCLAEKLGKVKKETGWWKVGNERFRAKDAYKSKFLQSFRKEIQEQLRSRSF